VEVYLGVGIQKMLRESSKTRSYKYSEHVPVGKPFHNRE